MTTKMITFTALFTIAACLFTTANAMECKFFKFGDSSVGRWADKIVNNCPVFPGSENEYCCYNFQGEAHCCDAPEFFVNVGIMLVIAIVILMLVSSIVSFVCCICCPCCCLYKRRRGRVHRNETSIQTNAARSHTEYQPIVKTHIPAGAYPVLPQQSADVRFYSRSRN